MTLPDQDASMVDGLGHSRLEYECLETTLQEVLDGEGENVIELVLTLLEEPVAVHPAKKSLALKDTARVLLVECEKIPGGVPDPAERILDPPELALAPEPVLSY